MADLLQQRQQENGMGEGRKPSRQKLVIEHLLKYRTLTRQDALLLFGVQNLADIIMRLRRNEWFITTLRRKTPEGKRYCVYYIGQEGLLSAYRKHMVSYHFDTDAYEALYER